MSNKHESLKELFDATADAIRSKTGSTGKIVADNFPDAISDIETGVKLPELSYPGSAADLMKGKQMIDENGEIVTGTMPYLGFGAIAEAEEDSEIMEESDGTKTLYLGGQTTNTKIAYVKPGDTMVLTMNESNTKMSMFGDAKPEDVAAGKIFTSMEGFQKVGKNTFRDIKSVTIKEV